MWFVLIAAQRRPVQAPHEGSGTSSRTSRKEQNDVYGWLLSSQRR